MNDWQVYLMMFVVVGLMLLGKKMMFFDDTKKDKEKSWKNIWLIGPEPNLP